MHTGDENHRVALLLVHKHYWMIPPWKQLSHYRISRGSDKKAETSQQGVELRAQNAPNGVDAGGQRVNDEEGDHPGPGAGVRSD